MKLIILIWTLAATVVGAMFLNELFEHQHYTGHVIDVEVNESYSLNFANSGEPIRLTASSKKHFMFKSDTITIDASEEQTQWSAGPKTIDVPSLFVLEGSNIRLHLEGGSLSVVIVPHIGSDIIFLVVLLFVCIWLLGILCVRLLVSA